ncbi:DUF2499 domain-containing protein [Prochlorococcus sp. MIT 1307]|uniref:DUF2499 domain-containing protein n=1 Tax=Prochlorococcus sp. MIT 1307 TaxID=3096219 RepID=UPI002A7476D7|nr:DUF2499 domain-containing protein [Prochlorococcus sp. MIT 1307]
MHALSLGTWFIHIATLCEWTLAIIFIARWGRSTNNYGLIWLAIAMLPNLASAMAAITWHIFDNSELLKGLVVLQAALTTFGNICLALAAWNLVRAKVQESST